jgi:Outer membrane lipoprotein-sorting protein
MKQEVQMSGRFFIMASVLGALGLFAFAGLPLDQPMKAMAGGQQATVNHPTTMVLTGDLIIAKLLERNRLREDRLQQYSVPSTYRVKNDKGKVRAEVQVLLHYRAPGAKEFKIVAETGSGLIRSRVFKPLMEIEVETAAGRNRHDSSVTPNNYNFKLLGEEDMDGAHCFVVQTTAKRADKYLFNGKVWIHAAEFAVVQIAGQPAKNPSVWIKRVEFVRRYQKIKEFWLPLKNESITQVRIFGKNVLTIDYDQYEITQVGGAMP